MTTNTLCERGLLACSRETNKTICAIMCRLRDECPELSVALDRTSLSMDLTVCHNLRHADLSTLLDFPLYDFAHDLIGITKYLDRKNGKLKECFMPRSRPSPKSGGAEWK